MANPWYTYPRIDNYGGVEPYGGFAKPDSNILVPDGTPITSPALGVVSGLNAPDGSLPAWGAVVTIKMITPYNSVATHIAFLHLTTIASGLHVGSQVSVGTVIGTAGSGPSAAGSQKAALGFAFYNGDYYGYGPSWAQYLGSAQLNPVPYLESLKSGKVIIPPPVTGGGGVAKPPVTQTITTPLKPNADVTDLLIRFDRMLIINNPFDVQGTTAITGLSITDPISWLAQFGVHMWNDALATLLRGMFLVVGGWLMLKVGSEFVDYDALVTGVRSRVGVS